MFFLFGIFMSENLPTPKITYLKDYQPPHYWIDTVDLIFDLENDKTLVHSKLVGRRNQQNADKKTPLVLVGENVKLKSIKLDSKTLNQDQYLLTEESLTLPEVPENFTLEIETEIYPDKNTELSGLYQAKEIYATQCEAEGFRRITYYLDRPDVLAKFTTTIRADKKSCPVLLSNGNCVGQGEVDDKRHWVKWEDPFKKPCYLFALVAGDLVALEDHFLTCHQRLVTLKIYVERENQDKCKHAMEALKKAMVWDEVTYGREYDLDIYMIVAVNDFNMGAMENKGLNIFNSKYILARPETATDTDYYLIDAVVGHEYFHNWSGNRITCRDWFQLSLKEGLTVFREHHFSNDVSKSPVSLIENTRTLRTTQFREDAGPLAHPVRPDSYIEINNFYTTTIYEKGAEVIRMLKTLLGWETFRKGMDLYFEKFDGQAVTIEDFVSTFESISNRDLTQFRLWYSQAGTPEINVEQKYDAGSKTYSLTLAQSCPATPGQPTKKPMHIPIAMGLLDSTGKEIVSTQVLELKEEKQVFQFPNIASNPMLSILRGFSAPVKVKTLDTDKDLAFLMRYDTDELNRWDSGQKLTEKVIFQLVSTIHSKKPFELNSLWMEAMRSVLENKTINPALKAEMLSLPSLQELIELKKPADIDGLYAARVFLKKELSTQLKDLLIKVYHESETPGQYEYSPEAVAARRLKNMCLSLLTSACDADIIKLCSTQWNKTNNMTDMLGALGALSNVDCKERTDMLDSFYDKWQYNTLVLDKWFRIQALSELPNTLGVVMNLMNHPAFSLKNPNKVYSLVGAFTMGNLIRFHDVSGKGYTFLADTVIKLDAINPQIAARIVNPFTNWRSFDDIRQAKMKTELQRIIAVPKLSKDVYEIATKSLS